MTNKLPPFSTLLKSRDVEDPVSVWVHRPLAYALVAVIHNTRVTPNQITLVAMLVGFVAAACWFVGTPGAMVAGGVLLWTSAILDGADGSLARAKQMQSDVGRALDGAADALVGAATVFAAFYYLWRTCEHTWLPLLMPIALVTTVGHIYLYDYYKEVYLHATRPGQGPRTESAETVAARLERARAAGESLAVRFSLRSHLAILANQQRFVRLTNPASLTIDRAEATVESAGHYRRYNYGPMQLWMLLVARPPQLPDGDRCWLCLLVPGSTAPASSDQPSRVYELAEVVLDRVSVGLGQGLGLAHGDPSMLGDDAQELLRQGRERRHEPFLLDLPFEHLLLPVEGAHEEGDPVHELGLVVIQGRLRPAKRHVVFVLAVLDDPLEGAVRNITVAGPKQHQGGQRPGQAAVSVLERVDRQEAHDEHRDDQQRVMLALGQRLRWSRPPTPPSACGVSKGVAVSKMMPTLRPSASKASTLLGRVL